MPLAPFALAPAGAAGRANEADPANAAPVDCRLQIGSWLHALGDRDPQHRAAARENLMSLAPAELPALRDAVAAVAGAGRLAPAQAGPLEAIVTYISTRSCLLEDRGLAAEAFLGITLAARSAEEIDAQDQTAEVGVCVANRLFGYVAYRFLEDGDIILAMGRDRDSLRLTRDNRELMAVVHSLAPGEQITINLIRGGRLLQLQFPLDVAPQSAIEHAPVTSAQLEASIDRVRDEAQAYFDKQFRPLLEPAA